MAFTTTSQSAGLIKCAGSFTELARGITALVAGAATVTVPNMGRIDGVIASAQSSNAVNVTATATNTFTLAGTGTDNIMWIAWGTAHY